MKFWFNTILILSAISLLVAAILYVAMTVILQISPGTYVINAIISCLIAVAILVTTFRSIYNKYKDQNTFTELTRTYLDSVNLLQNILYYLTFSFTGMYVVHSNKFYEATIWRDIFGSTLLTLKITTLIIQHDIIHRIFPTKMDKKKES